MGGTPLPGAGYNQFAISKGKNALIQLVNQFNQTYAGKTTPLGTIIEPITLPASFTFPYSFHSQDLRVTKNFRLHTERWKLETFREVFNLFNIANLNDFGASLTQPGFGQPAQRTPNIFGTGGPRAFQLGLILIEVRGGLSSQAELRGGLNGGRESDLAGGFEPARRLRPGKASAPVVKSPYRRSKLPHLL